MENKAKKLGRAEQIQFFRFVAFWMILLWHAKAFSFKLFPGEIGSQTGMYFFILLSGLVSSYSLAYKNIEPTKKNILEYIKKKIIKLYPLYFVTNLVTVIYNVPMYEVTGYHFKALAKIFIDFVLSSLLLQTWVFKAFVFNSVGWYVATIIWISIINIPFCHYANKIRQKSHPIIRFAGIIILGLLETLAAMGIVTALVPGDPGVTGALNFPLVMLGMYVAGMALGYIIIILMEDHEEWKTQTGKFTVIEAIVLICTIIYIYIPGDSTNIATLGCVLINIALLIVFMLGYGKVSNALRAKPLVYLGNISFEAYLIHQIVLHEFIANNGDQAYNQFGNFYMIIVITVVTMVLAAFLSKVKIAFKK